MKSKGHDTRLESGTARLRPIERGGCVWAMGSLEELLADMVRSNLGKPFYCHVEDRGEGLAGQLS